MPKTYWLITTIWLADPQKRVRRSACMMHVSGGHVHTLGGPITFLLQIEDLHTASAATVIGPFPLRRDDGHTMRSTVEDSMVSVTLFVRLSPLDWQNQMETPLLAGQMSATSLVFFTP